MTRILEGRSAIVTGAGSGIGRELALELAAHGANVAVGVRRIETGRETVDLVGAEGGSAFAVAMDVTDEAAVKSGVAETAERHGGIDIVIHNANHAASGYPVPADDMLTREKWREQSQISLGGAFLMARECHPFLKASGHGRLLLMSSTFGYHGAAGNTIYAAQKSAFRGLFKSLAREWGPDGIRVNGICPAAATDVTQTFFDQNPAMRDAYMEKFALDGIGRPREDIARAIAALCGDAMGYMTGHVFFLDGGMYPGAA